MTDITSITTALGGIKSAIDIAKTLRELDKHYDAAMAKAQHIELLEKLMEAKEAILHSKDQLLDKDRELSDLREQLRIKRTVVRHLEAYYDTSEDGQPVGDPYCARCYEADSKLIHPIDWTDGEIRCVGCGNMFEKRRNPSLRHPR